MKIALRYFTGTGNSLRVLRTCKEQFEIAGHDTDISSINLNENILAEADLVGFCFPVYAFDIPRIARKYLKKLSFGSKDQKCFVIITAGASDESGFAIANCRKLLHKKMAQIIYSAVIQMPINWTTAMDPPAPEEALPIIKQGVSMAKKMARDILQGRVEHHQFNIPRRYGKFGLYKEYLMFKYLGIHNLWRSFQVYEGCNGCGLCSRHCPTDSIVIKEKKPVWKSSCEQCMRCVNLCPQEAIFQNYGGGTKGRYRYMEPSFKY